MLTLSKALSKLFIIVLDASVPFFPSLAILVIVSPSNPNDFVLTFSILTFNVWESEVFAPTCKLISFPDIFSVVAALVPNLISLAWFISAFPTVNLMLFPFESVIVIVDLAFILPSVCNPSAVILYLSFAAPSISIFSGVPWACPLAAIVLIFTSVPKSSKSNPP